ncbi:hypothetical protein RchiOBHm_Chr1g0372141 [Rosa chinensis]|uniref:Uncharacterized protein n=1 Tax=Rosa chinensis TaxID=74649 RepID=A0A2P6SLP9_ROSCH|nr:hypothetical protein RchiOBHm_Chr1g0372141 [Rosa chinensis]
MINVDEINLISLTFVFIDLFGFCATLLDCTLSLFQYIWGGRALCS